MKMIATPQLLVMIHFIIVGQLSSYWIAAIFNNK